MTHPFMSFLCCHFKAYQHRLKYMLVHCCLINEWGFQIPIYPFRKTLLYLKTITTYFLYLQASTTNPAHPKFISLCIHQYKMYPERLTPQAKRHSWFINFTRWPQYQKEKRHQCLKDKITKIPFFYYALTSTHSRVIFFLCGPPRFQASRRWLK